MTIRSDNADLRLTEKGTAVSSFASALAVAWRLDALILGRASCRTRGRRRIGHTMVAFPQHAQRYCTRDGNAEVARSKPSGAYRCVLFLHDRLMFVAELGLGEIWFHNTEGRHREEVCIASECPPFFIYRHSMHITHLVRLTCSDIQQ